MIETVRAVISRFRYKITLKDLAYPGVEIDPCLFEVFLCHLFRNRGSRRKRYPFYPSYLITLSRESPCVNKQPLPVGITESCLEVAENKSRVDRHRSSVLRKTEKGRFKALVSFFPGIGDKEFCFTVLLEGRVHALGRRTRDVFPLIFIERLRYAPKHHFGFVEGNWVRESIQCERNIDSYNIFALEELNSELYLV